MTGYLTVSIDRWNNGKKAELADRVSDDSGLEVMFNGGVKEAVR